MINKNEVCSGCYNKGLIEDEGVYKTTFECPECGQVSYRWHHDGKRLENLPERFKEVENE